MPTKFQIKLVYEQLVQMRIRKSLNQKKKQSIHWKIKRRAVSQQESDESTTDDESSSSTTSDSSESEPNSPPPRPNLLSAQDFRRLETLLSGILTQGINMCGSFWAARAVADLLVVLKKRSSTEVHEEFKDKTHAHLRGVFLALGVSRLHLSSANLGFGKQSTLTSALPGLTPMESLFFTRYAPLGEAIKDMERTWTQLKFLSTKKGRTELLKQEVETLDRQITQLYRLVPKPTKKPTPQQNTASTPTKVPVPAKNIASTPSKTPVPTKDTSSKPNNIPAEFMCETVREFDATYRAVEKRAGKKKPFRMAAKNGVIPFNSSSFLVEEEPVVVEENPNRNVRDKNLGHFSTARPTKDYLALRAAQARAYNNSGTTIMEAIREQLKARRPAVVGRLVNSPTSKKPSQQQDSS